jgi:hypothetical protein
VHDHRPLGRQRHVATTATLWSNVVTGVIAVLLGLGAMSLGMSRTR